MFDLDFARAQFPALQTPWMLFDNAGGSAPARSVIERVREHLSCAPVQLGASYELSVRAGEAVAAGRAAAARLVNAVPGEIVLGPSSTALVGTLSRALRPLWSEGDEVIVTDLDHEANIGAWRALEASGIAIREWRFDVETAALRIEDLEALLTPRTRLVAFTHCSNVVGQIHDVPAMAALIRDAGALSCVDGVAFAPHRRVDVGVLGVDFYFLSLYKTYGPHLAMLWGRRELLERARGQNHFFFGEEEVPAKLEPGGTCYELVAGLPGILDYYGAIDERHFGYEADPSQRLDRVFGLFARHEMDLARPLLGFLDEHPRVRLYGSAAADSAWRVPTIAFSVDGLDSASLPPRLDERHMAARYGHFYAHRAIERLGLAERNGIIRISLLHYNSAGEVLLLIGALEELIRGSTDLDSGAIELG